MPVERIQAEEFEVGSEPQHIHWPVIHRASANLRPYMSPEVPQGARPGLDLGIRNDLPEIVVDEFEIEGLCVEGYGAHQGQPERQPAKSVPGRFEGTIPSGWI